MLFRSIQHVHPVQGVDVEGAPQLLGIPVGDAVEHALQRHPLAEEIAGGLAAVLASALPAVPQFLVNGVALFISGDDLIDDLLGNVAANNSFFPT